MQLKSGSLRSAYTRTVQKSRTVVFWKLFGVHDTGIHDIELSMNLSPIHCKTDVRKLSFWLNLRKSRCYSFIFTFNVSALRNLKLVSSTKLIVLHNLWSVHPLSSRTASTDLCLNRFFWATRFLILFFPLFFVSVPCARSSCASRQILSAR